MKYHLTSFGCQMNDHDAERMRGVLEDLGYERSDDRDGADLILFNTCTIRASADDRFTGNLGDAHRVKRERPDTVVAVGGCWAQSQKEKVFTEFPFVDIAFGPGEVSRLGELIARERIDAVGAFSLDGAFSGGLPARRERPFQAWVQISVGCNCVCSYCIVPTVRGRERSRPLADIVAEVTALAADGVVEVTLLGQNVNAYGRDLPAGADGRAGFAALLRAIDAVDGIDRIRYTSPHPQDYKDDVVRAHAELPSLCPHVHLPLQSGSSRILKAMRRTYDRARYLDRVRLIREHNPDIAITTDIIVAFPGETEEDFAQTLSLCEEVGFDGAFTFIYSPRRDTEAATFADRFVDHALAAERMERLVAVVQRHARERAQRFVGRTLDVLIEGRSRTDETRLRGRCGHNKVVNFDGLGEPGEIVPVTIGGATSQTLTGESSLLALAGG